MKHAYGSTLISGATSALLILAALGRASPALGQGIKAAPLPQQGLVNETNGSYNQTLISVEVPPFHGIEPKISVSYSSGGGNSFAGVGASIQGFSKIERSSPEKGAPSYTSSDIFVLDGKDLVPCATGSTSPSCTTCPFGSFCFSAKREDFRRISIPACGGAACNTGTWTVTEKNGVQTTYAPVLYAGANVFRWGVSGVKDPIGNTMNYAWWCDASSAGGECYPDHVTYGNNLATVTMTRAPACTGTACSGPSVRPDPYSFATGAGLASVNYLLASIAVSVNGSTARTYQITYLTSPTQGLTGTQRSIIQSVQEFGKDPAVGLPPQTLGFQAGGQQFTAPAPWSTQIVANSGSAWPGDFNGDGKSDFVLQTQATQLTVYQSTGSSFVTWAPTNLPAVGVNFVVADFNGDGLSDVGYVTSGGWTVLLSTGSSLAASTWNPAVDIVPPGNCASGCPILVGDFNGDGLADVAQFFQGGLQVDISTGSGFTAWPLDIAVSPGVDVITGDFNGDGKTDVAFYTGSVWDVLLATGNCNTPFIQSTWLTSSAAFGTQVMPGDFNGDGKTDLLIYEGDQLTGGNLAWHVLLSTGSSFIDQDWTGPTSLYDANEFRNYNVASDFNADGLTDLAVFDGTYWQVLPSTGHSFVIPSAPWGTPSSAVFTNPIAADFTGSGEFGLLYFTGAAWMVQTSTALPPLMTSFANGIGGTSTVTYVPSSAWPEIGNPPLLQTVSSVTITNGSATGGLGAALTTSTTSYSYANGVFNRIEREFLGFATVTKTLPLNPGESSPPTETTTFIQDLYSYYKPAAISSFDGSGKLLRKQAFTYATNSPSVPRASLETSEWTYTYDSTGASCGLDVVHTYDSFGNVTGETNFGSPPRYTQTVYAQNTAAFIVGLPGQVTTYRGNDATGPQVAQSSFLYDGASNWMTAPTAGLLTSTQRWLDTTNSPVTTSSRYDSFGNRVSQTDANGNTTVFGYDPTYNTFLVSTMYPPATPTAPQLSTRSVWDFGCASTISTEDVNGHFACIQLDSLCRPVETAGPGDTLTAVANTGFSRDAPANCPVNSGAVVGDNGSGPTTWTEYILAGGPGTQRVVSHSKDGSSLGLHQETFFDGLERSVQTCKKVEPPEASVSENESCDWTIYEPRGNAAQVNSPFYITPGVTPAATVTVPASSVPFISYAYDALNRVTLEEFWNASTLIYTPAKRLFDGWTTTVTNANGFQTVSVQDNRGQVIAVQQRGCSGSLASAACVSTTCVPLTSAAACAGTTCGAAVPDGCGGAIHCGACAPPVGPTCTACGYAYGPCCGNSCNQGNCVNGTCTGSPPAGPGGSDGGTNNGGGLDGGADDAGNEDGGNEDAGSADAGACSPAQLNGNLCPAGTVLSWVIAPVNGVPQSSFCGITPNNTPYPPPVPVFYPEYCPNCPCQNGGNGSTCDDYTYGCPGSLSWNQPLGGWCVGCLSPQQCDCSGNCLFCLGPACSGGCQF
jgi:YD repeat-containing protein